MAANILVQHGKDGKEGNAERRDYFFVDPRDIIANEAINGRHTPVPDSDILDLAHNMMEFGNRTPVECSKVVEVAKDGPNAGKTIELVYGFSRWRAGILINTKLRPEDPIKLKVLLVQVNAKERLIHNIIENRFRNRTTLIDDAFNQRRLREEQGMDDTQIAALYKQSPSWVSRLKGMLALSAKVQDAIATREIEGAAGLVMVESKLNEEDQLRVLGEVKAEAAKFKEKDGSGEMLGFASIPGVNFVAKDQPKRGGGKKAGAEGALPADENGQTSLTDLPEVKGAAGKGGKGKGGKGGAISATAVKKAVRKLKQEQGKKGPPLSFSQVKSFFGDLNVPNEDPLVRELGKKFEAWQRGDETDKQFLNFIYKLRDEKTKRVTTAPAEAE